MDNKTKVAAMEQADEATTNHQWERQRGLQSGGGIMLECWLTACDDFAFAANDDFKVVAA